VLEPSLLRRVYGVNVQVGILRGAEHLSVLPPGNETPADEQAEHSQPKVHIMAGGGSGELIMRALVDAHIPFVAGALNIGDSDHTLALRLASEVIGEQPYAPISPTTREHIRASLQRVSILILCSMPIGPGNLALLQEALAAAQQGLPVLLLATNVLESSEPERTKATASETLHLIGIATRDYTNGEAQKLMQELLNTGATVVESVGEALEAIKRCVIL
jgi:iron complex transport system ATP-binding protein